MHLLVEISLEADSDLEEIFDYTLAQYGLHQAVKYVTSFDKVFNSLVTYPDMGRDRSEIRLELRSIKKEN